MNFHSEVEELSHPRIIQISSKKLTAITTATAAIITHSVLLIVPCHVIE